MGGLRDGWVWFALIASVVVCGGAAATMYSVEVANIYNMASPLAGASWGALAIVGVAAFALLGLLLAILVSPRRGIAPALIALIIPIGFYGYFWFTTKAATTEVTAQASSVTEGEKTVETTPKLTDDVPVPEQTPADGEAPKTDEAPK